mmetsp:Transcript_9313/g.28532  ORF Transcript_9313/g.28532 Transcript_9313/m.28532 type:complete len:261 (-) Transcript_9313:409-1191(-)
MFSGAVAVYSQHVMWRRPRCRWYTFMRDPVSRLASALFYCQNHPDPVKDPLCGGQRLEITTDWTMHDMADHWGNRLFRELLFLRENAALAAMNSADASTNSTDLACVPWPADRDPTSGASEVPWMRWRRALRTMGCGDEPTSPVGAANLEVVISRISDGRLYDAVGIVEHFAESAALFDCRIPIWWEADAKWGPVLARHHTSHNSETWKAEESRAFAQARTDPYVLDKLEADILIYNTAVRAFRRTVADMHQGKLTCVSY